MNVYIRDSAALSRITPPLLSRYLEIHGWTREETWRSRITVWSTEHNEQRHRILAPLMELSDTYAVRISEAVSTLAEVEGRSQFDIYYEATAGGADVIRLQTPNGNGVDRRSLSASAKLLHGARELVASAARAAERPGQPVYRGRLSGEVLRYMDAIYPLPGYETGGDLTLHSRVPPDYGEQTDMGDPFHQPFSRSAALALDRGLREVGNTVREVLGGDGGLSSFEEAAQRGVSANMCDAVAALADNQHGIEISLSWAAVRPSGASDERFAFAESSSDVLTEGARWLRRNSPFLNAHVTGEVVRLDRQSQEEFDGRAGVLYELDGRPVVLNVQFDPADRDNAIKAFRDNIDINLDGDVYLRGNRYALENPRNFQLVR